MLIPIYEKRFEKEVQRAQKHSKDMEKLKEVMQMLISGTILSKKNRNHKPKGNFIGYWECHIEPDWLLIYKPEPKEIIFERIFSNLWCN